MISWRKDESVKISSPVDVFSDCFCPEWRTTTTPITTDSTTTVPTEMPIFTEKSIFGRFHSMNETKTEKKEDI